MYKKDFNYFTTIAAIVLLATIVVACDEEEQVKNVTVTGVTLSHNNVVLAQSATLTLVVDESLTLVPTVAPEGATNKKVKWSSSNTAVATIDAGVVTAKTSGTTTITVTTEDGNKTATCVINVQEKAIAVTGVTLTHNSEVLAQGATLALTVGEPLTLAAMVAPENATNKNVTWHSSNTAVATVDAGVVTTKAVGSTTITVTTADGNKTATCTVTVSEAPKATLRYETVPYRGTSTRSAGGGVLRSGGDAYLNQLVYSAHDDEHNYYMFLLGHVNHMPLAYRSVAVFYNGTTSVTIGFSVSNGTQESISRGVATAIENSTTNSSSHNINVSAQVGVKVGWFNASVTTGYGHTWGTEFTESRSITNTFETTQTVTKDLTESVEATIGTAGEPVGRYRWALFYVADVYYVLQTNRANTQVIDHYTTVCVRPNTEAWAIDFAPGSEEFGKTGAGDLLVIPNVVLANLPEPTVEHFEQGDGTAMRPFLIRTEEDLRKVGTGTDGWGLNRHYRLQNDIALTSNWTPIGTGAAPFTGTFDGTYKHVSNLRFGSSSVTNVGFFGVIGNGGVVKNLEVRGAVLVSTGTLTNVGFIAGENRGTVESVRTFGNLRITDIGNRIGSVVGYNNGGTIRRAASLGGIIEGFSSIGGIAGRNENGGLIEDCRREGNVVGGNSDVGGIVGFNVGSSSRVRNVMMMPGYIVHSKRNFQNAWMGGIAGDNGGTIQNAVAANDRLVHDFTTNLSFYIGAIAGYNTGTVQKAYRRSDMGFPSNFPHPGIVENGTSVMLTTIQNEMWWRNASNWETPVFDFNATNGVWQWNASTNLPELRWGNN